MSGSDFHPRSGSVVGTCVGREQNRVRDAARMEWSGRVSGRVCSPCCCAKLMVGSDKMVLHSARPSSKNLLLLQERLTQCTAVHDGAKKQMISYTQVQLSQPFLLFRLFKLRATIPPPRASILSSAVIRKLELFCYEKLVTKSA